jgi:Cu/Zn superoxide dismutase
MRRGRTVYQAGRLAGFALGIALFAALVMEGSTFAQEGQHTEVHLSPIGDSGVSGDATLEDVDGGMEVTLNVQGLPKPGVEHINHIHAGGTCADVEAGRIPPVTIPLKTITAQKDGSGSATTFVRDVSLGQIFGKYKKRLIIVHAKAEKGGGVPPGIACADLVQTAVNGTSLNDKTTMLGETTMIVSEVPSMGGPTILLPAAALLLGIGVLSYAVLRRRL